LKTNGSSIWNMTKTFAREVPSRVKGYVKENWGAPFILGFMALLLVAAVSLLMNFAVLADEVAVYAYYALVAGVVLQLVCFLKYGKRNGEPKQ
jgi:hypothetical protein